MFLILKIALGYALGRFLFERYQEIVAVIRRYFS